MFGYVLSVSEYLLLRFWQEIDCTAPHLISLCRSSPCILPNTAPKSSPMKCLGFRYFRLESYENLEFHLNFTVNLGVRRSEI